MAIKVVSPAGNNASAGTESAPYKTLNYAVTQLSPGDTLYLRGAVWAEWLNSNIPGGTSWSAPVKIASWPGERATIKPAVGAEFCVYLLGNTRKYIWFDDLTFDGTNLTYGIMKFDRAAVGSPAAHHIRLSNSEVKNCGETAIVPTYTSDYNEFLNLNIHDVGTKLVFWTPTGLYNYGWYIRGSYNVIDGCEIWRIGSSGLQIYALNAATEPPIGNVVRNCNIHHTCMLSQFQSPVRGAGLAVADGNGHLIYNNTFWENRGAYGVLVSYCSVAKIQHNTFFKNVNGVTINSASGAWVKNNLFWMSGTPITDQGSGTVKSGNKFDVDPHFVFAP